MDRKATRANIDSSTTVNDIEMPQIHVSNPLMSLKNTGESDGGARAKRSSMAQKGKGGGSDAKSSGAKVMINPLSR